MTEERAIVTIPPAAMPALTMEQALARRNQQAEFITQILRKGTDYGEIPGTGRKAATDTGPGAIRNDNSTLLKPGAEKLLMFFGLRPRFEAIRTVEDWTGKDYGGEPFFYYHQKCVLYRDGETMAEGDGSCNSRESKYRYRKGERLCPKCQLPNVRKSKDGGWYCWAKTGGCGATFKDGDPAIEKQDTGRVLNVDVADQANTILKMAQKRALIAATLIGVNASEYFTQDLEDLPHQEATNGEFRDITDEVRTEERKPAQASPRTATAAPAPAPTATNGKHWIYDTPTCKLFWAKARELGFTSATTHQYLGVTKMEQFKGTMEQALDQLRVAEAPADAIPADNRPTPVDVSEQE